MDGKERILERFELLKNRTLDDVITVVQRYLRDKAIIDKEFNELETEERDEIVSE